MTRFVSIIIAALVMAGTFSRMAAADALPVPPIPPFNAPADHAAPVPNIDARVPAAPYSAEPSVDVRLYRARTYDPSVGFVPGSRYQNSEDRKPIQTPGFVVSVPLK